MANNTDIKRGRGRPVTGVAMTSAQRQKAYRQRLLEKETECAIFYRELAAEEANARKCIRELEERLNNCNVTENNDFEYWKARAVEFERQLQQLFDENHRLTMQIAKLQAASKKRNVTKNKLLPDGTPDGYQQLEIV